MTMQGGAPDSLAREAEVIAVHMSAADLRVASIRRLLALTEDAVASLLQLAAWEPDPERAAHLASAEQLSAMLSRIAEDAEAARRELEHASKSASELRSLATQSHLSA